MIQAVAILLICQLTGETLARGLALPIPGPVLGMALLLAGCLLSSRLADTVMPTAQGLLSHLSLLFVPAGVGVISHLDVLGGSGPALLVVLVASTALALLQPGDTILGMSLDAGGHLTHGAKPNQSGKWFNAVQYGVRRDDLEVDYDQIAALAAEHKPKMVIAGGSAIPRIIDFARMREIADSVGAYLLVDMAHFAGLVAAGL
jgi:putative effector of murein hydrolase LrgA (UPF0299 family)